jgi:hypothetical protein
MFSLIRAETAIERVSTVKMVVSLPDDSSLEIGFSNELE